MWLLDTNAWIAYLDPKPNPVKTRIAEHAESQILICDIVKAELLYGAFKSSRVQQNLANLNQLFSLKIRCPLMAGQRWNLGRFALILFSP